MAGAKDKSSIRLSLMNLPDNYVVFLDELKNRIRTARVQVALSANRELVLLYWDIGKRILDQQTREGWGTKVIERLAYDLQREFPDIHGFSRRNLLFMRAFAEAYPEPEIVKQLVSQIPWGHIVRVIQTVKDSNCRNWYILQIIQNGWSRSILEVQIENNLYHRQGKSITNFERALPSPQSDLAQQITKDPYIFDFLSLRDIRKPVGVSGYITKLVETLPKKFKGVLPSPEEIEAESSKANWTEKSDEK